MIDILAQIVGWTLIHSLWQGAFVATVAALLLAVVPRASARARYRILCGAVLTHLAAPLVTAAVLVPDVLDGTRAPLTGGASVTVMQPSAGIGNPPRVDLTDPVSLASRQDGLLAQVTGAASNARLERFLPLAVALWALGVGLGAMRRIGGWLLLRRIVARAVPVSAPFSARVTELARAMGVGRAVTVLTSGEINGPFTIGWLRPVIVMPLAMLSGLNPVHVDAIVAHELAHVRRWDYLVAIVQSIATTILFHHPATWWLDRRLRVEREFCCDDLAVATSRDRVGYVRALAELESIRLGLPSLALAATDGSLQSRAVRLLSGRTSATPSGWVPAAALVAVLSVAGVLNAASEPALGIASVSSPATTPNDPPPIDSQPGAAMQQGGIIRHPDPSASFDTRWAWAMARARQRSANDEVVIGWLVRSAVNDGSMIVSSTNGTSWTRGRSVAEILGVPRTEARGVGIFLNWSGGEDGQLHAVLLRDVNASLALGDRPLLWLHSANDAASIARLEQLLTLRNGSSVRSELAAALTLHDDRAEVLRAVTRVFETEPDQQVRGEAIAWLGNRGNDSAVVALLRRAIDDPAPEVRDEALGALGGSGGSRAKSALLELLGSSKYADVRSEVVQQLAGGGDDVVAVLLRIAFEDPEDDVRSEAVDAIAGTRGNAATQALREIAQRHPERRLRSDARDALDERGFR